MFAPIPDQAEVRQVNVSGPELSDNSISVPKPGGGALRFQYDKPTPLSEQEILTAGTTGSLLRIYAEHGYDISSPDRFIEQIHEDWNKLLLAAWDSSKYVPLPDTLHPIIVESQGIRFGIYGVFHNLGGAYKESVERTLRSQDDWSFEFGIVDDYSIPSTVKVIQLNDHAIMRPLARLGIGLGILPLLLELLREDDHDHNRYPSPLTIAQEDSAMLKLSWRYHGGLPAYMLIESSLAQGLHTLYRECTRDRSALMALEAMGIAQRLWKSDCNILCGGLHADEIAYFLCNPHQAPTYVQVFAKKQIELFLKNPEDYERAIETDSWLYEPDLVAVIFRGMVLILLMVPILRGIVRICKRWIKRNRPQPVAPMSSQTHQETSP